MNVVDFAKQIIEMQNKIDDLEYELSRCRKYEQRYRDLLDSSLQHSGQMVGNMLNALLDQGSAINIGLREKAKQEA